MSAEEERLCDTCKSDRVKWMNETGEYLCDDCYNDHIMEWQPIEEVLS